MNPYDELGGEAPLRSLVARFYQRMDARPESKILRAMHPKDISSSEQKLFEFLSGWLGGPPLFSDKYGHPRLRQRHLPFAIDTDAATQWMTCMSEALGAEGVDANLKKRLEQGLHRLAMHMRNQAET